GHAAEPPAGGVVHGIGDGGDHADHRDLAEALDAHRVHQRVGLVDEVDLDLADVGVHRYRGFLQRGVEAAAEAPVDLAGLPPRRAESPHDAAADLAGRGHGADDPAAVHD